MQIRFQKMILGLVPLNRRWTLPTKTPFHKGEISTTCCFSLFVLFRSVGGLQLKRNGLHWKDGGNACTGGRISDVEQGSPLRNRPSHPSSESIRPPA